MFRYWPYQFLLLQNADYEILNKGNFIIYLRNHYGYKDFAYFLPPFFLTHKLEVSVFRVAYQLFSLLFHNIQQTSEQVLWLSW